MSAAEIARLLDGIDIDTADVIASQSKVSAGAALAHGFVGAEYDLGAFYGDREGAEQLLKRPLTRRESRALEACIRVHLRGATS